MFVVAVTCSAIDSAQFTVTDERKKQLSWCWHGIREQWQTGRSDWDSNSSGPGTHTHSPGRRGGITAPGGQLQEPGQAHRRRSMQPAHRAHKHSASSGPPGPTPRPLPQSSRHSPPWAAGSATRGQACQRGAEADTPGPQRAPRALTAGCRPGPAAAPRDRGSARTRPSTRGRSPRAPSTSPP